MSLQSTIFQNPGGSTTRQVDGQPDNHMDVKQKNRKIEVKYFRITRVSKSCNHAITLLCKILENLHKFRAYECLPGKTGTNILYLPQFNNVF